MRQHLGVLLLCKSTSSPVVRTRARSARLATGKRIKSRRPHQSTQCLFCDGRCGSTSVQFRKAKLQYGQKHSRLARLERVAILLVSSCSTTLLHLPQAAQCREPSPVVRIRKSRCPHGGSPVVANTIYSLLFFCTLLNLAFYPRNW